ncbi:MAG: hypothetical protein ACRDP8_05470 [Actinopolymorphaceae bacterium]
MITVPERLHPLLMIGDPAYDAVQCLLFRMGDLADPVTEWAGVIAQGTTLAELEARKGDLWIARLVHRLRE